MTGTRVSAWLPEYQKTKLEKLAQERSLTVSALVREVLENYLSIPNLNGSFSVEDYREEFEKKTGIKLMLKPSELAAVDQSCQRIGKTRQSFMISALRFYLANEVQFSPKELDTLVESTHELRKIGVNLNQIAHSINADRKSGKFTGRQYNEILELKKDLVPQITTNIKNVRNVLETSKDRRRLSVRTSKRSK